MIKFTFALLFSEEGGRGRHRHERDGGHSVGAGDGSLQDGEGGAPGKGMTAFRTGTTGLRG